MHAWISEALIGIQDQAQQLRGGLGGRREDRRVPATPPNLGLRKGSETIILFPAWENTEGV